MVQSVVESGVGEAEGGLGFCTVAFDAPDMMRDGGDLASTYMVTSIPMLLSFDDSQIPRINRRVFDIRKLSDRHFVEQWLVQESRCTGTGGGGGPSGGGLSAMFGGLFGGLSGGTGRSV